MSSIGLLVASPAPFSADVGADALSEHPGLYPTNDPLGLGLDFDKSLPLTLLGNSQTGITWESPAGQGNTIPAGSQGGQQKPYKTEKPGDAEKEPQTQMIQASHRRRRSKANVTSGFQTEVDQRERFLESNRLAANRCRQKKKEHIQRLETLFTEEEQKKKQLEGDTTALCDEILSLKDEILRHALCEDGRVGRRHLAHTMQRITQSNNAGASSSSVSASSSGLLSMSASLVRATSPAATAASLPDESSSGVSYVDERKSGDINGETMSLGSEASHPLVDGTETDMIDAYTYLT